MLSSPKSPECLTSLIGREAVFPLWYEPCMKIEVLGLQFFFQLAPLLRRPSKLVFQQQQAVSVLIVLELESGLLKTLSAMARIWSESASVCNRAAPRARSQVYAIFRTFVPRLLPEKIFAKLPKG